MRRETIKRYRYRPLVRFLILAVACGIVFLPKTSSGCDSDSVLDVFEHQIAAYETVRMRYDKTAHSILFGDREPESGTLWLGQPKRYRIEMDGQTIVRGSDTLWVYTESTGQVTIRTGNLDSLEFGPMGFFGSLRRDFFVVDCESVKIEQDKFWRVRLAAKTETAAIQRLTLWIDVKTHWPKSAEYVDYNEETARLIFSKFRTNHKKDKKRFHFSIPKNAEVIVLPTRSTSRPVHSDD